MSENKSKYVKLVVLLHYTRGKYLVFMDSLDFVTMTHEEIMQILHFRKDRINKIANIDIRENYINVIQPIANQYIVVKRTRDKSKYIIASMGENNNTELSTVTKEQILENPYKYFNITISNNRIYTKYKLERAYQMSKQIEDYIDMQNYNKKATLIGDESVLDISYNDSGNKLICNGYKNKHYIGDEILVIPDFINIIADGAFSSKNIRQVILGKSIERIGERSFQNCIHLHEIKFNENLKYIGSYAFKNCTLTEINLENTSIEKLLYNAFLDESNNISNGINFVEELVLPKNLKEIILPDNWHQYGNTLRFPYQHVRKFKLSCNYKNLKLIDKSIQNKGDTWYNILELQANTIKLDNRNITLHELQELIYVKNIHFDFIDIVRRDCIQTKFLKY